MKKYWPEALILIAVVAVFVNCMAPAMTWINTDSDGPHYLYSAKYLYPSHKTSAPLFLLLGNLFLRLPVGTEFWRLVLISVLASSVTLGFVYLSIRHLTGNRAYAGMGALLFGSSALVISQTTIVESYALITMASVGCYYFAITSRWKLSALLLGIGVAVHPLVLLAGIPIVLRYRELRRWKPLLIAGCFLLFYLYIPITNRPPYMWFNEGARSWWSDIVTTTLMLVGGISLWDLPARLFSAAGLILVTFLHGTIVLFFGFGRNLLTWLLVLPIILYVTDLAPQTYVYLMPSVAWGSILLGVSLPKVIEKLKFGRRQQNLLVGGLITAFCLMLGTNSIILDIGNALDPNLEAQRFYDEELPKVEEGGILVARQGWEWAIVYLYNKQEGKDITPICLGTLPSPLYQVDLEEAGIDFVVYGEDSGYTTSERADRMALSIIERNDNVFVTKATDARHYGALVEPAIRDGFPISQNPYESGYRINWRFEAPYDIITGRVEVEHWTQIIFTNFSFFMVLMLGTIGGVPVWVLWQVVVRKRKWSGEKLRAKLTSAD